MRALSILELLSLSDGPMALGEVATRLKLPKSSALSLLRALVAGDFCVTDGKGLYALGIHTFEVGAGYLRSMTPVRSVTPELEWLTEVLAMTSHFAVLQGDEVIYLAKHDPAALGLKLASSLGARVPAAVTAVGKAQLAYKDRGPMRGRRRRRSLRASPFGRRKIGPSWAPSCKVSASKATRSTRGRLPSGSDVWPLLCSIAADVAAPSALVT